MLVLAKGNKDFDYIFNYEGKTYPFSVFSDRKLQNIDKKILESNERYKEYLHRVLKLACSLDLVNPRVAIGNSLEKIYSLIIIYQENGIEKVIDYSKNLIMTKKDYYELYKFNELNIVSKMDLYNIYYLLTKFNNYQYIFEYLLFTKEIFDELSKKNMFSFFKEKYNINGLNKNNYLLFGNNSDSLFFWGVDSKHSKFEKIIREVNDFTENPQEKSKHISYDKEKDRYMLKERKFGYFTFDLISSLTKNEEVQKILLSKERYGECHINANILGRALEDENKKSAFIVGGKFKINEIDYFYHTWVEIDDNNTVLDFNHNIVMNRDKYYKLFEIVPISKTPVFEMEDIIKIVENDADLGLHPMYLNYFGSEVRQDLKKNEMIFKK